MNRAELAKRDCPINPDCQNLWPLADMNCSN
jgi:hypothetical protein